MGREIRRVPANWEHPKDERTGKYIPLYEGYNKALGEFASAIQKMGLAKAIDYHGGGPRSEDYMPEWSDEQKTHIQAYETCTEGTPISPPMKTPEELAHWLADNHASAFGSQTASYEDWLELCKSGWAPSAIMDERGIRPGFVR